MVLAAMSFCVFAKTSLAADTVELDNIQTDKTQKIYEEARPRKRTVVAPVTQSNTRRIHQHSLSLGLGQIFVLGSFEKYGADKMVVDLFYEYSASYSFDLVLNAHWSSHEKDNNRLFLRGYALNIKSRIWNYDSFSPYIMGGLGIYNPQVKTAGETSKSEYVFGINGGMGAELQLNNHYSVGFLGYLHMPFNKSSDNTPDVKGSYFKLLLMGKYTF